MKNKFFLSLLVMTLSCLLYSCRDFIEADLDKKTVTILAPANNTTSPNFSQLFWWEEVKDATEYNLQIVKPSFAATQKLMLDTTVKSSQFSFTLKPGSYQWRLRALNSTSHTEYVIYNLTIDSTLDLSGQPIVLLSPANNYYTKNIGVSTSFTWNLMPNADSYIFQVVSSTNAPLNTQTPITNAASYTFTAEGIYTWKVLAQNANSATLFSTYTITVDTTRPVATSPIAPLTPNDTITANPIILKWNSITGADSYRIQVSSDSTFTGVTKDTTTASTTYNLYNATAGIYYYWRVKTIDKALNESIYFTRRRIKRN
jgi:hypothetical protein